MPQAINPEQKLNINMAVLDVISVNEANIDQQVQLFLDTETQHTLIANLSVNQPHVTLSINIYQAFTLRLIGDGIIHICGWLSDQEPQKKKRKRNGHDVSSSSYDSSSSSSSKTSSSSSSSSAESKSSKLSVSLNDSFESFGMRTGKRRRVSSSQREPKKLMKEKAKGKKAKKSSRKSKKHKK